MASAQKPTNPIFQELLLLQEGIDADPNPEDSDFLTCRSLGTSKATQGKRCGNPNSLSKQKHIKVLLELFSSLDEIPSGEDINDKIEDFLNASHCFHHRDVPLLRFEEWKRLRSQSSPPKEVVQSEKAPAVGDDSTISSVSEIAPTLPSTPGGSDAQPRLAREVLPPSENYAHVETVLITETITTERLEFVKDNDTDPPRHPIRRKPVHPATAAQEKSCVEVEALTGSVSALQITATMENSIAGIDTDLPTSDKIPGLGSTTLRRTGSLRDDSPVVKEFYQHLTPQQQQEGVLYILEHTEIDGLYKIGCTKSTADARVHQPNNCYGTSTRIIHETVDGPFVGASKAEKLVDVILRHHRIEVRRCEKCGHGHKDWFKVPKEKVQDTVKLMEDFVRLPGYTLQDGAMKLSPLAHQVVTAMCSFTPQKLEVLMAKQATCSYGNSSQNQSTDTTTTTKQLTQLSIEAESLEEIDDGDYSQSRDSSQLELDPAMNGSRRPRKSDLMNKLGHTTRKAKDKTKTLVGRFGRSRESTPEPGEGGNFQHEGPRTFSSFLTDFAQAVKGWEADFKAGYRGEGDE